MKKIKRILLIIACVFLLTACKESQTPTKVLTANLTSVEEPVEQIYKELSIENIIESEEQALISEPLESESQEVHSQESESKASENPDNQSQESQSLENQSQESQNQETPVDRSGNLNAEDLVTITYVCNTNTMKFHYPYCSSVDDMKAKNRKDVTLSREEVIALGYVPCKRCEP